MKPNSYSIGLAIAVAALVASPQVDAALIADWDNTFTLQTSGGFINPLVLVGFNPVPEPPEEKLLNLGNPSRPIISQDTNDPDMSVLFAIGDLGMPLRIREGDLPDDGQYDFDVLDPTGRILFEVFFDINTDSGGVPIPGSWESFNPQPEPPIVDMSAIGFDFSLSSTSIVSLTMTILDANENSLRFSEVSRAPIPATWWLIGAGLGALGVARTRRRRAVS